MKVLITTYWYEPAVNGVVTSVKNLEKSLRARGHEVRVLTLSEDMRSRREGNVYRVGSTNVGRFYPDARVPLNRNHAYIKELIRWKPDVVHSQCEFFTFSAAKKIADRLNIPLIHTYHTIYEDYTHYFSPSKVLGRKAVSTISRFVLGKTDAVVVPTDKVRSILRNYEVEQDIFTVPSGIDFGKFAREMSREERKRRRAALGIGEEDFVLLVLGRLAKEKNIDMLLDSMKSLPENVKLLIVGDGPYKEALENRTDELELRRRVIFTGMVSPDSVQSYYKLAEVFVSASNSETQGLTYFEALASGIPAVCKADPCLIGVIKDGENGYQFSSAGEFCSWVGELIANPKLRQSLSESASRCADSFSVDTFGEKMERVYNSTIDGIAFLKSVI